MFYSHVQSFRTIITHTKWISWLVIMCTENIWVKKLNQKQTAGGQGSQMMLPTMVLFILGHIFSLSQLCSFLNLTVMLYHPQPCQQNYQKCNILIFNLFNSCFSEIYVNRQNLYECNFLVLFHLTTYNLEGVNIPVLRVCPLRICRAIWNRGINKWYLIYKFFFLPNWFLRPI